MTWAIILLYERAVRSSETYDISYRVVTRAREREGERGGRIEGS